MLNKIIITDYLHPHLKSGLIESGFEVDDFPDITNEELSNKIESYHGLILSTKISVNKALIDKACKLKFIARAGSGMENIDVQYAASKQIHIISTPEANANAVAEHALGMLLSLCRNICASHQEIKQGIWLREQNRGIEIDGKTIGIIGYGHTGKAFAKKLSGFDLRILAYDKYISGFSTPHIIDSTLLQIQKEADIISFHLPLTHETKFMLNSEFIEAFSKPIIVINTSRGKIIHTKSLLQGIFSKKILGAVLDVFENENFYQLPKEDHEIMQTLIGLKNVLTTPHIAGWTFEAYFKISDLILKKIKSFYFVA